VPTAASASVTDNRLELDRRCELGEKKILKTAKDAQNLIANLDALANAAEAAPGRRGSQINPKTLPPGKETTLCLTCIGHATKSAQLVTTTRSTTALP
jgi:hypothetical protein